MNHITEDNFFRLASIISDRKYADEDALAMLDHIDDCQECFSQLCNYIAIYDATGPFGVNLLFHGAEETSYVAEASVESRVVASFKILKEIVQDKIKYGLEQIDHNMGLLYFDQPLILATRGAAPLESTENVCRLEDIENEYTFIVYDPSTHELCVQISNEDFCNYELWVNDARYVLERKGAQYVCVVQNVNEHDTIEIRII